MTKIQMPIGKIKELMEILSSSMKSGSDHLNDDLFIRYSLDILTEDELQEVIAHMELCDSCASKMEHLMEEGKHWLGEESEIRLSAFRTNLLQEVTNQITPEPHFIELLVDRIKIILGFEKFYAYCPDCGNRNIDQSNYCAQCGRRLSLLKTPASSESAVNTSPINTWALPMLKEQQTRKNNRLILITELVALVLLIPFIIVTITFALGSNSTTFRLYSIDPTQIDINGTKVAFQSVQTAQGLEATSLHQQMLQLTLDTEPAG
jgi:hypothetical protein